MLFGTEELEWRGYTRRWKKIDMFIRFDTTHEHDRHTDAHTDRQTDTAWRHSYAALMHSIARQKSWGEKSTGYHSIVSWRHHLQFYVGIRDSVEVVSLVSLLSANNTMICCDVVASVIDSDVTQLGSTARWETAWANVPYTEAGLSSPAVDRHATRTCQVHNAILLTSSSGSAFLCCCLPL